jgi:diguanylate cyclase (GGDEF)-like protein
MAKQKYQARGSNSAVKLLLLAAIGAVLFTLSAGGLVYGNTKALISAAERVKHTQDVLASLQRVSLLIERIDYRSRMFLQSGNEEQMNRVLASANQLVATTVHVQTLVSDNPNERDNARNLLICAKDLGQSAKTFDTHSSLPERVMQHCQETIGLMNDQEESLLVERNQGSERRSLVSMGTEIAFVTFSLVSLAVLFGLLLRDAIRRQRQSRQTSLTNRRLEDSVNALKSRAQESDLLTSARDELQLCIDVQQVYKSAANSFARLLEDTSGSLCIINNSRQLVEVVSMWGDSAVEDFHTPDSCCGLRSGQPRWRLPGLSEIDCTHFAGTLPERYLCQPIVAHGNTLGLLYVQCPTDEVVEEAKSRIDGVRQLVQLTGMAVATLNLRTKLENQSIRDSLTGLFNRHFMQISLERELARASRRKQILAVYMLDLDHFKRFNDSYGHGAGDAVLKAVAEIFRNSVRTEDIACRYGGEEFTIILPDVTRQVAYERAECIRRAVAALRVPLLQDMHDEFSVSIGVALYPGDGESAELLLSRADQALYRAKRSGRNQVVVYEATVGVS